MFKEIGRRSDYGHGDMHPGNIMQRSDQYLFIDFESVFHSKSALFLDYINLIRFDVNLIENDDTITIEKNSIKRSP